MPVDWPPKANLNDVTWDKVACKHLMDQGLSFEHAMIAVGQIAEHRQAADRIGYSRGYNMGYKDAGRKT